MTQPELTSIAPRDHVVQFYERADELVRQVGDYLLDSLESGGSAVVVARPAHMDALAQWLSDAGIEPDGATRSGRLLLLDAGATLARVLVDGRPDRRAFGEVIGWVIARASRAGTPVHAYGEMVDLLWDAGHTESAIELEACWNELASKVPFALYCSYQLGAEPRLEGQADPLHRVCQLHSHLRNAPLDTRPWPGQGVEAYMEFPATLRGPRQARHFVVDTLAGWGQPETAGDAAVVVTELATNAVVHARSAFDVTVRLSEDMIRISVRDASGEIPVIRSAGHLASSGRGVQLVSKLSTRWGTEPAPTGKAVWAELALA